MFLLDIMRWAISWIFYGDNCIVKGLSSDMDTTLWMMEQMHEDVVGEEYFFVVDFMYY